MTSTPDTGTHVIAFSIPGAPVGKGRPRFARRGAAMIAYTPEKTASYENLVKLAAVRAMQESGQRLFEGPVSVDIDLRMPIPASWSRRKRSEAICGRILPNKPDMDNAVKALFDALNGIAWIDDKQAVRLVVEKRYAQTPGVDVTISALALPVLPENREKNTP